MRRATIVAHRVEWAMLLGSLETSSASFQTDSLMKAALRLTGATLGMYGLNDCRKLLPAVAGVTSESNGMGKALYYNVSLKRKELAKAKLR